MAIVQINRNPTPRQLRQFGLVAALALPLLAWLWTKNLHAATIAAACGCVLAATGLMVPRWLKPLFIGLSLVTLPIGLVVSELVLLTVWLTVFCPLAMVFRILGRDVLDRHGRHRPATYWKERHAPADVRQYFRQW